MNVLYLGSHGPTNIRLLKDGLVIGDSEPIPPPEFDYDTILIGNTKGFVSYAALKCLGKWGITVALLGRSGVPFATFVPFHRKDAPLRLAQMKCALEPTRRLQVARAIVTAKTGKEPPSTARSPADLRMWEGVEAARYWSSLGINRRSGYLKSVNQKATTKTNAAINAAQGIHSVKVRGIISKVGLDPEVGFLHNSTTDKEAFALDAQEFARPIVDRVAIEFAEAHPDAFLRDDWWVYRLTNDAMRQLALRVGQALSREVRYEGERVTVENVITRELRALGVWFRAPRASLSLQTLPA